MIGAPTFIARSMTLQIFSAYASDSEPPKTVKSWLKTKTQPAVDRPVAGDDAVAEDDLRRRVRSPRTDEYERVELDERVGVEQQVESLARGQLAAGVLLVDPDFAATEQGLGAHRFKPRDAFFVRRQRQFSAGRLCARTAAMIERRRT